MIDEDVALTLFYIVCDDQDRRRDKVPFFARATIIPNILEYFETQNNKMMSLITQKETLQDIVYSNCKGFPSATEPWNFTAFLSVRTLLGLDLG